MIAVICMDIAINGIMIPARVDPACVHSHRARRAEMSGCRSDQISGPYGVGPLILP